MVGWVGSASVWLHSEGILNLWEEEFAISCICASLCVCVCHTHTHTHYYTLAQSPLAKSKLQPHAQVLSSDFKALTFAQS